MIKRVLKLLLAIIPTIACGQYSFETRQVLTDTKDSIFLNATELNIDTAGNYLAISEIKESYYLYTPTKKIGPLHFKSGNEITTYYDVKSPDLYYYTTQGSVNIAGPIIGEDISDYRHPVSNNYIHSAIPVLYRDSISIYIDGNSEHRIDLSSSDNMTRNGKKMEEAEAKKYSFENDTWLAFSDNGNSIYYLEEGNKKRLYKNGSLLDSMAEDYSAPMINNNGFYVYVARQSAKDSNGYAIKYAKTRDSIFGPIENAWTYFLRNDDAFYLKSSGSFILIDNHLYDDVSDVDQLKLLDKNRFVFLFKNGNDSLQINVSGKIYPCNFPQVQHAIADTNGNYAFYTLQDYYLYKVVNGRKVEQPLTKYGVRAHPLYISPTGKSLHYFRTDDSTYIWNDDVLLFAFSNKVSFQIQNFNDLYLRGQKHNRSDVGHSLFYMFIDSACYTVYEGTISPQMPPAHEENFEGQKIGDIINGAVNENSFYIIQKTGKNEYTVNISNRIFRKINNLDKVLGGNCFFDGKQLIFYGIHGYAIQQYKFKL